MLILRRKVGEKIVIGDGIVVVVTRVSGARVTLGIDAPPAVHIVRGELRPFNDIHADDTQSCKTADVGSHPDEPHSDTKPSLVAPIEMPMTAVGTAAPHLPR